MRNRLVTALAVVALVAAPATAGDERRKPPPSTPRYCQLPDAQGDTRPAAFDITCAAVEFGRKTAVGMLRLRTTSTTPTHDAETLEAVAGASWTLTFRVAGAEHTFERVRRPGAEERYEYRFDGHGVRDVKVMPTEIRWTIPRDLVRGSKPGGKPELLSAVAAGVVSRDQAGPAKPR